MISDRHKIVFVHLRRTGGNSIEQALGGIELLDEAGTPTREWDNRLHRGRTPYKIDRRGHPIHDTAEQIRRRYPDQFDRYFKFSIVRNPWAQMASLFLRRRPDGGKDQFADFLERFEARAGTIPQVSLFDSTGQLLVDFVGRFERLDADFKTICMQAGIVSTGLPVLNKGPTTAHRSLYNRNTAKIIETLFREDIARFDYAF